MQFKIKEEVISLRKSKEAFQGEVIKETFREDSLPSDEDASDLLAISKSEGSKMSPNLRLSTQQRSMDHHQESRASDMDLGKLREDVKQFMDK